MDEKDKDWSDLLQEYFSKVDEEIEAGINHYESVQGTWAFELKRHWDEYTKAVFTAFDQITDLMRANENMDKYKWREYVLYDMTKRHFRERKEMKKIQEKEKV